MTPDQDGKPKAGASARWLGVRPDMDLPVNEGMVVPGTGGMSVSPKWYEPYNRLPKRYLHPINGSNGRASNSDSVWVFGLGSFEAAPISPLPQLRPDHSQHGLIEPLQEMPLNDYQTALASTRTDWREVPVEGENQPC